MMRFVKWKEKKMKMLINGVLLNGVIMWIDCCTTIRFLSSENLVKRNGIWKTGRKFLISPTLWYFIISCKCCIRFSTYTTCFPWSLKQEFNPIMVLQNWWHKTILSHKLCQQWQQWHRYTADIMSIISLITKCISYSLDRGSNLL